MSDEDTPPASYNGLPKELKLDIWEQACRDAPGRVVALNYLPRYPPRKPSGILEAIGRNIRRRLKVQRIGFHLDIRDTYPRSMIKDVLAIMTKRQYRYSSLTAPHSRFYYVDDAAREAILKTSVRLFPENSLHEYITADLSKDILLISPRFGSIGLGYGHFLFEASPGHEALLRQVAFESYLSGPLDMKISIWGIPRPPENLVEIRFVRRLFTYLRQSLEMVMLMSRGVSEMGEGETDFELELTSIQEKPECWSPPFNFGSYDKAGKVENMLWHATFVRRTSTRRGKRLETTIVLSIVQYLRTPGQTLRVWDAEKRKYVKEVIGEDQPERARAYVESIARHYAAVANRATVSCKTTA